MREKIAIVFCDIDGCLNSGKHKPLDLDSLERIRRLIAELHQEAIRFVLTTGRPQPYAEAMAQVLDLQTPFIFENGSGIFNPADDSIRITVSETARSGFEDLAREVRSWMKTVPGLVTETGKELSISLSGAPIYEKTYDELQAFTQELVTRFGDERANWAHSNTAIDITMHGIDKWSACQTLLDSWSIDAQYSAAIGDSGNDLPVLRQVGLAMCPANAPAELKSICGYLADTSFEKGTEACLRYLLQDVMPGGTVALIG